MPSYQQLLQLAGGRTNETGIIHHHPRVTVTVEADDEALSLSLYSLTTTYR
jgi:hypothetical protein